MRPFLVWILLLLAALPAAAHPGHEHDLSTGVWPAHQATDFSAGLADEAATDVGIAALTTAPVSSDNRLSSWKLATGATGTSTDSATYGVVSQIVADVNAVAYNDNYVFIRTSGIPSHAVGPSNNPSTPGDIDATYRIARNPTEETGTRVESVSTLGPIGVMVNGAAIYSPSDGTYWIPETGGLTNAGSGQPANTDWSTNALWRRANGMDDAGGHPSPVAGQTNADGSTTGFYHYHRSPTGLLDQIDPDNTGSMGSPVLGYAFDGFPIIGPYAYEPQGDGSLNVVQMASSYTVGDPSIRGADGPSLNTYELGSFIEDFVYEPDSGTLNEYNMAFVTLDDDGRAVLAEETDPEGQWAYFATLDVLAGSTNDVTIDGSVAWPYLIGPEFFGVVDQQSIGGGQVTITLPNNATYFFEQLTGDFNADGMVDAADYSAWRDCLGADHGALPNDPTGEPIGDAQYDLWAANYGATVLTSASTAALVPEPLSLALTVVCLVVGRTRRVVARS